MKPPRNLPGYFLQCKVVHVWTLVRPSTYSFLIIVPSNIYTSIEQFTTAHTKKHITSTTFIRVIIIIILTSLLNSSAVSQGFIWQVWFFVFYRSFLEFRKFPHYDAKSKLTFILDESSVSIISIYYVDIQ